MQQLKEMLQINKNFQKSINLRLNYEQEEKIDGYIPTRASVQILKKYMEQIKVQDLKSAEQSVHTLKGVASNLGLTNVSDLTQKIVDEIRGEKDIDKINAWTKELEILYTKTVEIISAY